MQSENNSHLRCQLQHNDEDDSHVFSLYEGDTDNTLFSIDGNKLVSKAVFDFELKNELSIRIKVTDSRGASFSRSFTIVILDIDENPVPINDIRLTNHSVDEKLPAQSYVSKMITFDENRMDYHTYSLVEGEGDAENAYFTIRIQTTDKGGKTYSMKVTVNLNNTSGIDLIPDSRYHAYFSNDMLVVKSPETGNALRIEMYNITGQLVLKESLDGNESNFRLNGVSKGIYILNFIENNLVVQ